MKTGWLIAMGALCAFGAAADARPAEWKILRPVSAPQAYDIAAKEFQKYYGAVTEQHLEIATEPAFPSHSEKLKRLPPESL